MYTTGAQLRKPCFAQYKISPGQSGQFANKLARGALYWKYSITALLCPRAHWLFLFLSLSAIAKMFCSPHESWATISSPRVDSIRYTRTHGAGSHLFLPRTIAPRPRALLSPFLCMRRRNELDELCSLRRHDAVVRRMKKKKQRRKKLEETREREREPNANICAPWAKKGGGYGGVFPRRGYGPDAPSHCHFSDSIGSMEFRRDRRPGQGVQSWAGTPVKAARRYRRPLRLLLLLPRGRFHRWWVGSGTWGIIRVFRLVGGMLIQLVAKRLDWDVILTAGISFFSENRVFDVSLVFDKLFLKCSFI